MGVTVALSVNVPGMRALNTRLGLNVAPTSGSNDPKRVVPEMIANESGGYIVTKKALVGCKTRMASDASKVSPS
jgi:hypothetical protein